MLWLMFLCSCGYIMEAWLIESTTADVVLFTVPPTQCTNDMTFFISANTDNHRYNPIFISADTDKLPIQFFLYRPIPIPITDITIFIIYTFFIMIARKIILKLLPLCQLVVDRTREKNYPFVFCTLDFYILQNKVKQCSISS